MPAPLVLPDGVRKVDGRWVRNCPFCGIEISHLRRNYCGHAALLKQPCKRCSNATNHPSGMHGPVRVAWYNSFEKSALSRGYCWEITISDIATLYELQNGRCALTGWPISWSSQKWEHTASIDRLDNTRGYLLNNVQLVHKSVNMSRGTMEIEDFVEMCKAVANKEKW